MDLLNAFRKVYRALLGAVLVAGCGGGGGGAPPAVSSELVYGRHRDGLGQIVPILAESGAGFDALEVDSPAMAIDAGRPGNDRFLLYYEATGGGGLTTIGLVSSGEEDLLPLQIQRTQVIGLGGPGSGFDFAATDPTVVVDKRVPFGTDGRYRMWFEGLSGNLGQTSSVIHATSADGVTWGNFAICSGLGASFASERVSDPAVLRDGLLFKMWFEAIDVPGGSIMIGYAESADGVSWTVMDAAGNNGAAAGPVLLPGPAGNFDGFGVGAPSVVQDQAVAPGTDGRYRMWYEATDSAADPQNTIGYATSPDGLTWSNPTLPVLVPSSDSLVPLPFDSGDIEHPMAAIDDSFPNTSLGHYLLWYAGDGENSVTPNRIGLAKGRDGP